MTLREAVKLREAGRFRECLQAIDSIERSKVVSPKMARGLKYLKGDVLLDMKRYRDAVECYERIIADEVSDVAFANKGMALWELGEFRSALAAYLAAIKLNPANEIALRGAGEMHLKLDAPKAAVPFLKKALHLNPKYQAVYTALGIAFYQLQKWTESYRVLKKAIALDPDDWQAKKGLRLIEKNFDL